LKVPLQEKKLISGTPNLNQWNQSNNNTRHSLAWQIASVCNKHWQWYWWHVASHTFHLSWWCYIIHSFNHSFKNL